MIKKAFSSQPSHILLGLTLLLLLLVPSSSGQVYQSFNSQLEQIRLIRLKVGPLFFFPTFPVREMGLDNNVYYHTEEDKRITDYTATFSPEVTIFFPYRNSFIFTLKENPEYVYYAKEKSYRSLTNSISPGLKFLFLNRFVISGDYYFRKRYTQISREIVRKTIQIHKGYDFGVFYETGRGTAIGFSGKIEKILHENVNFPDLELRVSEALNRTEKSGHLEVHYRIFTDSVLFWKGGFTNYDFENPDFNWRNSRSYQSNIGIQFPQIGRVTGTFSIGYKKHAQRGKGQKGFSGIIGNTNMDVQFKRFSLHLEYYRDNHFSSLSDLSFFTENRYGAGGSFYLINFIRLDYNYTRGIVNYPEPMPISMPFGESGEIMRRDINLTHRVGLIFRVYKKTGIGIVVTFWNRMSNFPGLDTDRTILGFRITNTF